MPATFKWVSGRQSTGYEKMLLLTAEWPVSFDVYLMRYKQGSFIPPHRDPAPSGRKHYRLNIFLKHAKFGGNFRIIEGKPIFSSARAQLFRPDECLHMVSEVSAGTRYVLSFGLLV